MKEQTTIILVMIAIFVFTVAIAWGWGFLIGGGLVYLNLLENPYVVAWAFAGLSGFSLLFSLLTRTNRR